MTYKTLSDLTRAIADESHPFDIQYLSKLIKVYWDAHEASKDQGYVGVGCITCAEEALQRYQEDHPPTGVSVPLGEADLRLLHALASTAGTTPEDLASRYLAGRITNEARQLMGGS
jgi:hypothetical protein